MAEEVQISGTNEIGKIRNPLGVIGLSFVTLGIYGIVWYYKTNKELAALGKARGTDELGDSPGTSVLAVTLGAIVIVPAFISIYNYCKRIDAARRLTGVQEGLEPGLLFVIYVFLSPVATYLSQSDLNKVLQAQASGAGGGQLPPQGGAPQQQPQQRETAGQQ